MKIHMGHKHLLLFFFSGPESSVHISLPQISLSQSFRSCSFQTPDHPAKAWATAHRSICHIWPLVLPSKVNTQVHCLKFCPLEEFTFTTVLQGCPRKGLPGYNHPLLDAACILCRTICKLGPSLFFCHFPVN